jgi:type II secretory pathway pseudopilin PulG
VNLPQFRIPHSAFRASFAGFTILETLVVLLIFMILLGMTLLPASRWHRQQRLRSAVTVVESAVRLAREHALTRQEGVAIMFANRETPGNTLTPLYWIRGASGDISPTNSIPDGLAFFVSLPHSTNGQAGLSGWVPFAHHFVCVDGDPDGDGFWAVITTQEMSLAFDPSGVITSECLSFITSECHSNSIGIVEASQSRSGLAMTGLVAVVSAATGRTATSPPLP